MITNSSFKIDASNYTRSQFLVIFYNNNEESFSYLSTINIILWMLNIAIPNKCSNPAYLFEI